LRRSQRKNPRGAKRSPRHSSANVSSVHAVRSNRLAQGPLANILRRGAFDQRRSTPAFAPSTAPQSTEYRTCSALDGGKTRTSGLRPCNAKSRSRGASHGAAELQAPAQKQQCPGECPGFPFAAQAAASSLPASCLLIVAIPALSGRWPLPAGCGTRGASAPVAKRASGQVRYER